MAQTPSPNDLLFIFAVYLKHNHHHIPFPKNNKTSAHDNPEAKKDQRALPSPPRPTTVQKNSLLYIIDPKKKWGCLCGMLLLCDASFNLRPSVRVEFIHIFYW
jgi:hypothetical protein